jgi:hypothetical protein
MDKWTVMVYMAGDNNLSGEMAETLEQIKQGIAERSNINLYVYFDGNSQSVPTLYCDFNERDPDKVRYFRSSGIADKLIDRETKRSPGFNENSAAMNSILNFVHWCVSRDKGRAEKESANGDPRGTTRYALIFSGHSFGFNDWGLMRDDSANYYMTLRKLRHLFERITDSKEDLLRKAFEKNPKKVMEPVVEKEETTEILGQRLDLLGFDSCEMSGLEIAHQFEGLATTMVASEGTVPNSGWNYAEILLGSIPTTHLGSAQEVAVGFVREFITKQNRLALADGSTDMTAWDLTFLPDLEAAFESLAKGLLACFADKDSVTYNQMRRVLTYVHWQCQTYSYVDLGDLCQLLVREIDLLEKEIGPKEFKPIANLRKACANVLAACRDCVLLTGYSGSDFQYSRGISVFFPWSLSSYEVVEHDYTDLYFIRKTEAGKTWKKFLKKYLGEISMRPANPLTRIGLTGEIETMDDSVVYESYTIYDEAAGGLVSKALSPDSKRPPNTGKRPPNTGKRPPDTGKRPPDTGKGMSANMSVFLSRFMKLKNFEQRWNRTGFKSSKVRFNQGKSNGKAVGRSVGLCINIPAPTGIDRILDLVDHKIEALGKRGDVEFTDLLHKLHDIAEKEPTDSQAKVFSQLEGSPLIEPGGNGNGAERLSRLLSVALAQDGDEGLATDAEDMAKVVGRE